MSDSENDLSQKVKEFNLDSILVRIGQFGKFQLIIYSLICLSMIFVGIFMEGYIFIASSVVYRCRINECDGRDSGYHERWTAFAIPLTSSGIFDSCKRYEFINRTMNEDVCYAEYFDRNSKANCDSKFIFRDKEVTISNDFNIFCADEWKLSMVGTIGTAGQFFGVPVGGYFSDKYGRRTILAVGGFLISVIGIIRSFSFNYFTFISLTFLENLCGGTLFATLFILGLELVGRKARVLSCTGIPLFFSVGEVLLALVAKYVLNWRWILRILYIPALGHILFLWIIPESIPWLLSQGEEQEVRNILLKAAKVNKRKLSENSIENLLLESRRKLSEEETNTFPLKDALKLFFWRMANCAFCWFTNVMLFYGISINSTLLGGNKYDNFIYVSLIEIPGTIIPYWTIDRFGRRYNIFVWLIVCGASLAASASISSDLVHVQLVLFLLGKMTISASISVLYIFTAELFPPNARNSLVAFCSMFGRVGSMLAPQTLILAKYYPSGPAFLFSTCALISGMLSLFFPETTNVALPSTLNEAKEIGIKGRQSQ